MSWMQVMIALTIGLLVSAGAMGSALQAEREFCYQYRLPRKNIDIANYLEKVAEGRVKCDRQCLKDARALFGMILSVEFFTYGTFRRKTTMPKNTSTIYPKNTGKRFFPVVMMPREMNPLIVRTKTWSNTVENKNDLRA